MLSARGRGQNNSAGQSRSDFIKAKESRLLVTHTLSVHLGEIFQCVCLCLEKLLINGICWLVWATPTLSNPADSIFVGIAFQQGQIAKYFLTISVNTDFWVGVKRTEME